MASNNLRLKTYNTPEFDTEYMPAGTEWGAEANPDQSLSPARRLSTISTVLRLFGAVLVVAAGATFLLQQWGEGSDFTRYLMLLALTAALGASGFICGLGVHESRGARTLLGLVLAFIPVHFAVLGGLLHSQFPWDAAFSPNAPWNAGSPASALMLTAIGIGTLVPLGWVAMMVMARRHATRLMLAMFAANAPVLIPVRDPALVAWVVAGMFALVVLLEWRIASLGYAMRTGEGRFIRALIVVPVGIVIGRSLIWYNPTVFFMGLLLLSGGVALFSLVPRLGLGTSSARTAQQVAALGAVAGCLLTMGVVLGEISVANELFMLVFMFPAAALLLGLSFISVGSGADYRFLAVLLSVGVSVLNLVMFWSAEHVTIAGIACLLVGTASVVYSVYTHRKLPLLLGVTGALAGFAQLMAAAIEIENLAHWGSLAFIGVLLILIAALFERYSERLLSVAKTLHGQLERWEY